MCKPLIVITIIRVLQPRQQGVSFSVSFSLGYILASSRLFLPYYTLAKIVRQSILQLRSQLQYTLAKKMLAGVYSSYKYTLATTYSLDFGSTLIDHLTQFTILDPDLEQFMAFQVMIVWVHFSTLDCLVQNNGPTFLMNNPGPT